MPEDGPDFGPFDPDPETVKRIAETSAAAVAARAAAARAAAEAAAQAAARGTIWHTVLRGGSAVGGWLTGGGLGPLAVAVTVAVAIGIGIGFLAGPPIQKALTPPTPPVLPAPPTCKVAGAPTTTTIVGCYWGSERSLNKTLVDAENYCKSMAPGYCTTGGCLSGECIPTANSDPTEGGLCGFGWYGRQWTVNVTCICGCGN